MQELIEQRKAGREDAPRDEQPGQAASRPIDLTRETIDLTTEESAEPVAMVEMLRSMFDQIIELPGMTEGILEKVLDKLPRDPHTGKARLQAPMMLIQAGLANGSLTAEALDASGRLGFLTDIDALEGKTGTVRKIARQLMEADAAALGLAEMSAKGLDDMIDSLVVRNKNEPIPPEGLASRARGAVTSALSAGLQGASSLAYRGASALGSKIVGRTEKYDKAMVAGGRRLAGEAARRSAKYDEALLSGGRQVFGDISRRAGKYDAAMIAGGKHLAEGVAEGGRDLLARTGKYDEAMMAGAERVRAALPFQGVEPGTELGPPEVPGTPDAPLMTGVKLAGRGIGAVASFAKRHVVDPMAAAAKANILDPIVDTTLAIPGAIVGAAERKVTSMLPPLPKHRSRREQRRQEEDATFGGDPLSRLLRRGVEKGWLGQAGRRHFLTSRSEKRAAREYEHQQLTQRLTPGTAAQADQIFQLAEGLRAKYDRPGHTVHSKRGLSKDYLDLWTDLLIKSVSGEGLDQEQLNVWRELDDQYDPAQNQILQAAENKEAGRLREEEYAKMLKNVNTVMDQVQQRSADEYTPGVKKWIASKKREAAQIMRGTDKAGGVWAGEIMGTLQNLMRAIQSKDYTHFPAIEKTVNWIPVERPEQKGSEADVPAALKSPVPSAAEAIANFGMLEQFESSPRFKRLMAQRGRTISPASLGTPKRKRATSRRSRSVAPPGRESTPKRNTPLPAKYRKTRARTQSTARKLDFFDPPTKKPQEQAEWAAQHNFVQIAQDHRARPDNYAEPGLAAIAKRAQQLDKSLAELPAIFNEWDDEGPAIADVTIAQLRTTPSIWNNKKAMPKWIKVLKRIYLTRRPKGMAVESDRSVKAVRAIIKGLEKRSSGFGAGLLDTTSRVNASAKKRSSKKKPKKSKPKKAKAKRAKNPPKPKKVQFAEATSYFII